MLVVTNDDVTPGTACQVAVVRRDALPGWFDPESIGCEGEDVIGAMYDEPSIPGKPGCLQGLDDDLGTDSRGVSHGQADDRPLVLDVFAFSHRHILATPRPYDGLMEDGTDRIAQHAAGLLHDGRARTISSAIHAAGDAVADGTASLPGRGQVHRHLVAMRMQSLGHDGYMQLQRDALTAIDEFLGRLSWEVKDIQWRITGRAAEAGFDGSDAVHLRILTSIEDSSLCDLLEEQGFEITRIGSTMSRHGRMNEIRAESVELEIVLLRCPDPARLHEPMNLVSGRPVSMLDATGLARRIEACSPGG